MPEAQIYRAANRFKADLANYQTDAVDRLRRHYAYVLKVLDDRMLALAKKMEAAASSGEPLSQAWLFQEQRYRGLVNGVRKEMELFNQQAERIVSEMQNRAVDWALKDSRELIAMGINPEHPALVTSFVNLPTRSLRHMVGFAGDGSPLHLLFLGYREELHQIIEQELVSGVALGINPRQVARSLRDKAGMPYLKAETLARTEMMRAYRETSHETYLANADLLEGWYWQCTFSSRTCLACLAMHGSFHPVEERMESHPRCRCTQVPKTRSSFSNRFPEPQSSQAWFDAQSEATKKGIMGQVLYEKYNAGEVEWSPQSLVKVTHSERWGRSIQPIPLAEVK